MRKEAILIACGAMLVTFVASAQDTVPFERNDDQQIGTRFKRQKTTVEENQARAMQKDVARCVVYRNKDLSREILAKSDTFSIDFDQIEDLDPEQMSNELDLSDCLVRAMKSNALSMRMVIPHRTLRNLMAEEVYLMDQDEPFVLPASASELLDNRYYAARRHPSAVVTAKLSDCITHHSPAQADAFLRSRPGSDEENEVLQSLYPAFFLCAGEGIADADIDISMVRTVIADGKWARMHYGPSFSSDTNVTATPENSDG